MLFLFTISAYSLAIYGIDIGSQRIKVGTSTKDLQIGIQQSLNKRYTPNTISLSHNGKWYIGPESFVLTIQNSSGLNVRNPFKYLINPTHFKISDVHPIQACSIFLGSLLNNFVPKTDKAIVVVPTNSNPAFRFALKESLELANVNKPKIVEQSTSISTYYAVDILNRSMKGSTDIMFIDVGAKQTEISHWRYKIVNSVVNAELIQFNCSKEISGNAIDKILTRYALDKINKELNNDEIKEIKLEMKKLKEELFLSNVLNLSLIANFSNKYNVTFNLTLEDFKNITRPCFDSLLSMLKSFRTPNEVELVGGASKFPLFNSSIYKFYSDIPIKTSINVDEGSLIGAIYYEAIQLRFLHGIKLNITKKSLFDFSAKKRGELLLIKRNTAYTKKIITLMEKSDFKFSLRVNGDDFIDYDVNGLTQISKANLGKLNDDTFITNATFEYIKSLDTYGLSTINAINKVDNKEKIWKLRFQETLTDQRLVLPSKQISVIFSAVNQIKESRNKPTLSNRIQLLIYNAIYRIKYDPFYDIVTTPEEREKLLSFLEESKVNMKKETNVRLFKKLLGKVEMHLRSPNLRADELEERKASIDVLKIAIKKAEEALPQATTDEGAIKNFFNFYNFTKLWCEAAESQTLDPLTNPIILSKDIYRKANTLLSRISELFGAKRLVTHFNTPPPVDYSKQENKTNQTENSTSTNNNTQNNEL